MSRRSEGKSPSPSWRLAVALAVLLAIGETAAPAPGARANYFPNVVLETQEGKSVRFYDDLMRGRIVVVNFMYTRCDGT